MNEPKWRLQAANACRNFLFLFAPSTIDGRTNSQWAPLVEEFTDEKKIDFPKLRELRQERWANRKFFTTQDQDWIQAGFICANEDFAPKHSVSRDNNVVMFEYH